MSKFVELDDETTRALEFGARMANLTVGQLVARLVAEASMPPPESTVDQEASPRMVAVFADYDGHRTHGNYDKDTKRIDITSGPLRGTSHRTPTGAARAVISHYKPQVNPNRNGWSFWSLDDGSGRLLQTIR